MEAAVQIENYFKGLLFEERSHTYTVKGLIIPSVSSLLKQYITPFDAQSVSIGTARKLDMSPREVRTIWNNVKEEACNRGTRVHNFAENYAVDRTLVPLCPQEQAAKDFWDDMPDYIVPVFMEIRMWHKIYMFAGTADLVVYNKNTKMFFLLDYKTNKDLFKNYKGQTLKYPFNAMLDTPFSKYTLQLSYYQILFEQSGFKIGGRMLIWLDKNTGKYSMYSTKDCTQTLMQQLSMRN